MVYKLITGRKAVLPALRLGGPAGYEESDDPKAGPRIVDAALDVVLTILRGDGELLQ
jgi:hypothetical protein